MSGALQRGAGLSRALRLEFRYFQFKERSESRGPMLEQKANEMFGDEDPTGFGTGWWSGVLAALFGLLAFRAVGGRQFPSPPSSPRRGPPHPTPPIRILFQAPP